MPPTLTPQAFVAKWRKVTLKESAATKEHFLDLCSLLGHPTPAAVDAEGTHFTFEYGAAKLGGGQGFADVFKRGFFGWEYKGKHANLDKAYLQLLQYRAALHNPPLLVVSDIETIVIHPNFVNRANTPTTLTLDDLLTPAGLERLRAVFYHPAFFETAETPEMVTRRVAEEFARLADLLRQDGHESLAIAHFLIRLLFCLFAEDVGLLPEGLFGRLVARTRAQPVAFASQLSQLFAAMASGGWFGAEPIPHVNGGLFDNAVVLPLAAEGLDVLTRVAGADWSAIDATIFGTLFERGLDPAKRAQLGAHYTSRDDILLIVEPVLMAPLRRRWASVQEQAQGLAAQRDQVKGPKRAGLQRKLQDLLVDFATELARVSVLDPAAGSGNFLYLALLSLLDLWKAVYDRMLALGLTPVSPLEGIAPSPGQLYGIEINPYAHELAQATIWIGYIQWLRANGFGAPPEPILKPIQTVRRMDAILAYDAAGQPVEPAWPQADVIIGNPPFLGDKKMRAELGDKYVDSVRTLYDGRVPGGADLVSFWFEKTRAMIEAGKTRRAGLLATNSIRFGSNRKVLDRIKNSGDIFLAWADRAWVIEGAALRVSVVGFDRGQETEHLLDGKYVDAIHADLSSGVNIAHAVQLPENQDLAFLGMMKAGPFDISSEEAESMLHAPANPNGRSNADVVKPRLGAQDITGQSHKGWVIDFVGMSQEESALYELPFEFVRRVVKPVRDKSNDDRMRKYWWLHGRSRPALRQAIQYLPRCIVTPEVAKHRLFVWMRSSIIPDHTCHIIARGDDYFFGVLHSRIHELWSLAIGNYMGKGNDPRYNSSRTFETFPFPWPPGQEPADDGRVQVIAAAAQELVRLRDAWLNPPDASAAELKKRTLTNLYNARPTWLDQAHKRLDAAVLAAYGWPVDLGDGEILARLLALNLARAGVGPSPQAIGSMVG
jgi:type II restriction/modification system DNA methylase subunit YeeA